MQKRRELDFYLGRDFSILELNFPLMENNNGILFDQFSGLKPNCIELVKRQDVAQMFIENPQEKAKGFSFASIFATHPPIPERIRLLEQY